MRLFKRIFKVVEVEVPRHLDLRPEGRQSLAALRDNAGFNYLLNKLRLQRASLESRLKLEPVSKIEDVIRLQEGIRWMHWLENQFLLAVQNPSTRATRDPNAEEYEALQRSLAFIEGIGEP